MGLRIFGTENGYGNKVEIAAFISEMGARAVTTEQITGVLKNDARGVHRAVNNTKSHSGRVPVESNWFLQGHTRRKHGAILLLLYSRERKKLKRNPEAHSLGMALAYRAYLDAQTAMGIESPQISLERFHLLVGVGFEHNWHDIAVGGASKFPSDNVKILPCKVCNLPHLVEAHELHYVCPGHSPGGTKATSH